MSSACTIAAWASAVLLVAGCSFLEGPAGRQTSTQPSLADNPPAPPVYLNYVYVTLDAEAFALVSQSPFIREQFSLFGVSEPAPYSRTPAPSAYLLGRTSCIEFIAPGESSGDKTGNSGICFGTANRTQLETVYRRMADSLGPAVRRTDTTFDTSAGPVPWLSFVTYAGPGSTPALATWLVGHDARFHKVVGPNSRCRLAESAGPVAVGPATGQNPSRLFDRITGVTLELTETELRRLAVELTAYGYTAKRQAGATVFSGPGVEIRATVAASPRYRVRALRCSLTQTPPAPVQMTFGRDVSLMIADRPTATWLFGPANDLFARN